MASLPNPNPSHQWHLHLDIPKNKTKQKPGFSCISASPSPSPSPSHSPSSHVVKYSQNADLPPVLPKKKKKPFISAPRRGGFLAEKGEKKALEDPLSPPGNGLLVEELVPVAYTVLEARKALLCLLHKLSEIVPVKVCKFCAETHVGTIGHDLATCEGSGSDTRHSRHVWMKGDIHDVLVSPDAYHCFDRFQLIRHEDRFSVKRLPALVELCIQAGVDLPAEFPTLRRVNPIRRASGANITEAHQLLPEFQREIETLFIFDREIIGSDTEKKSSCHDIIDPYTEFDNDHDLFARECEKLCCDWRRENIESFIDADMSSLSFDKVRQIAEKTLRVWEMMKSMTWLLMERYTIRVCGYCPEVHIGPRGHKVRLCGEFKHQWRQGQHGWQVAGIDDIIPPKYVWHVPNLSAPLLVNERRRYYGKAPAIVELCVQAGAMPPKNYKPMMRFDVVVPAWSEVNNAI